MIERLVLRLTQVAHVRREGNTHDRETSLMSNPSLSRKEGGKHA